VLALGPDRVRHLEWMWPGAARQRPREHRGSPGGTGRHHVQRQGLHAGTEEKGLVLRQF